MQWLWKVQVLSIHIMRFHITMDPGTGVRFRLRIERNSANVITGDVPSEL